MTLDCKTLSPFTSLGRGWRRRWWTDNVGVEPNKLTAVLAAHVASARRLQAESGDSCRFDLPRCAKVGFEGVYTSFTGLPMLTITFRDGLPAGDAEEVRGSDPPIRGRDG